MEYKKVEYLSAYSQCIVEQGSVEIIIGDKIISFLVEQIATKSSNFIKIYLDDEDHLDCLVELGVEFGEKNIILTEEFEDFIWNCYNKIDPMRGSWQADDYEELLEKINF